MPDAPRVAVTGAAGYIGSRLVTDLRETHPDWDVVALDNFYLGKVRSVGDLAIDEVDVRDREALESALAGADAVAHLAAISGVDDCDDEPDLAYETNVVGTGNVAWWCRKSGAAMLFPFSMAVLGDPHRFPITIDHPRDPLNWYGRTKYENERSIETFADGAFPAIQFMISNLYGEHRVGEQLVSKGTVINFFVDRALAGEPLTVYEPGTQARNFVHVKDVARAFRLGIERALDRRRDGATGTWKYEIGTDDDLGIRRVAELVRSAVEARTGEAPLIELVENPRSDETLVSEFGVDTTAARDDLDWRPTHDVASSIEELVAGLEA
jgi:nucleoside-diphosphate-sugar epimerase